MVENAVTISHLQQAGGKQAVLPVGWKHPSFIREQTQDPVYFEVFHQEHTRIYAGKTPHKNVYHFFFVVEWNPVMPDTHAETQKPNPNHAVSWGFANCTFEEWRVVWGSLVFP